MGNHPVVGCFAKMISSRDYKKSHNHNNSMSVFLKQGVTGLSCHPVPYESWPFFVHNMQLYHQALPVFV